MPIITLTRDPHRQVTCSLESPGPCQNAVAVCGRWRWDSRRGYTARTGLRDFRPSGRGRSDMIIAQASAVPLHPVAEVFGNPPACEADIIWSAVVFALGPLFTSPHRMSSWDVEEPIRQSSSSSFGRYCRFRYELRGVDLCVGCEMQPQPQRAGGLAGRQLE